MLELFAPSSELRLTRGFLDLTLAYVAVLTGAYALAASFGFARLRVAIRAWWHVEFALRSVEAVLLYRFGIGFSPLVLYHVDRVSLGLALVQGWPGVIAIAATAAAADWISRRVPAAPAWRRSRWPARVAVVSVARSRTVGLCAAPRTPTPAAGIRRGTLADNWFRYAWTNRTAERLSLTTAEHARLNSIGIRFEMHASSVTRPARPRNLITILPRRVPRPTSRRREATSITPASLPTSIDSPGIAASTDASTTRSHRPSTASSPASAASCPRSRTTSSTSIAALTRNLSCLSDILHNAGYHQLFLSAAPIAVSPVSGCSSTRHRRRRVGIGAVEQTTAMPAMRGGCRTPT